MNEITTFGSWLKRQRKLHDLTQKDLADKIGCSAAAIQKIEGEERRPSRQIAEIIADVLKIPAEQRGRFIKAARGDGWMDQPDIVESQLPGVETIQKRKQDVRLPVPALPIIGREMEIDEIIHLLHDPGCRLLTILGEGGIGKTRLSIEVARQLAAQQEQPVGFRDGIFFLALASVTSPAHLLSAVAEGIGFSFSGQADEKIQLFSFLHDKQALLLFDNVEHLVADMQAVAGQVIAEILNHAPGVKLLVTSRVRINLQEEWEFEVGGLPYPLPSANDERFGSPVSPEMLQWFETFSAIRLFLQTVRRRDKHFQLTVENYAAVLRICHLVNGLPLGIELAAGWASLLTCDEIAREIESNLDFLSTPMRNVPERHRSIRAAFNHSWKLLTEQEQMVLARLAVFRGGFQREAAEFVAGTTLPILSGLIDKSLVHRSSPGRFGLHELVRQYSLEHLKERSGVYDQTLNNHSRYFLSYLEKQFPALRNEKQGDALVALTTEIDNLRLAWDWAVRGRLLDDLRQAAIPFMVYHELRNLFHEGEAMFQQALAAVQDLPGGAELEITQAVIMSQRAWFGFRLGKMGEAVGQLRETIALFRKYSEAVLLSEVLWYYAFACWFSGAFEEALQSTQEGITLNQQLNRRWQVAIIHFIRGGVLHDMGAHMEAGSVLGEAVRLCRNTGDPRIISNSSSMYCRNQQALNQFSGVKELLLEGLRLATETNDRYGMGMALEQLGLAAQAAGDVQEARDRLASSIRLFREIGDPWSLSRAYNSMGKYHLGMGEVGEARACFREALQAATEGRAMAYAMDALASLAWIEQKWGSRVTAFRYAACILQHANLPEGVKERASSLLAGLKSQMTPEEMQQAVSDPLSMEARAAQLDFIRFS